MELESDKTRIGAELNRKKTELENARKEKEDKELEKDDLETIRKQCLDQLQADLKACGADLSVATDKSLDELLDLALACLGGGPLGPGACMREALHYAASLEEIDNALNCIQVNLARKEGCYRNDARIATLAARIKQLLDIIRVLRPQVDKLEKHYQDILTTLSDVIDLMSYWEGKKQQALDAWDRCKRGE